MGTDGEARRRLLRRIFPGVQAHERRETFWAAGTVLLVLVAHAILETARDALFLAHLPASRLPWMYLALAGLTLLASRLLGGSRGPRSDLIRLVFIQIAAAAGTGGFVLLLRSPPPGTFYALYVWGGFVSMLILIRFWLLLAGRFTASQAKRLFPVVAAGPVLGSLCGYGLAGLLSRSLPPVYLIGASAGFYLLAAGGSFFLWRAHVDREESAGPAVCADTVSDARRAEHVSLRVMAADSIRHPYARRVVLLLLLAMVTVTIGDFVFKSMVARSIAAERLGSFLATAYLVFELASLGLLLAAVAPLVRAIGVTGALAVQPVMMLGGGLLLTVFGGFASALCLRGVDGALRWSLHKTAAELLYVPMSPRLRATAKEAGDILAHRGGQAVGSLVILGWLQLTRSEQMMGPVVVVLCGCWLLVALRLRGPYLELFRETLDRSVIARGLEFPDLDVASLETLITALNDADDRRVIASMELLHQTRRTHLVPALILYHPSSRVVVRALELFGAAGRDDFLSIAERLFGHGDAEVRAAAVRAYGSSRPDRAKMEEAAASSCPIVSATAISLMAGRGWADGKRVCARLERLLERGNVEIARSVARALRDHPSAPLAPLLIRLADDADPVARREAVAAIGAARDRRYTGVLIRQLGARDLRDAAREALLALGEPVLDDLDRALADLSLPRAVRVHLPRTISRFPTQRAADTLLRQLAQEPSGLVRYKILRGLGRMVADHPALRLDAGALDGAIERQLVSMFRQLDWRVALVRGAAQKPERRTTGHELLVALLREKESLALERLFRTLGLRYREEDLARIYRGLRSSDPAARSSSLELLEVTLPAKPREAVLGLVDDLPDEDRLESGRTYFTPEPLDYESLLLRLVDEQSATLSALASYHGGEIGLASPDARADSSAARFTAWLGELRDRSLAGLSLGARQVAGEANR